jgi:O-antigen ligase
LNASDRDELWFQAFNSFLEKPLFGWGWGNVEPGVHNTFLAFLAENGFLGTLPLLLYFYFALALDKRFSKTSIIRILILMSALLPALSIDAHNKRFYFNGVVFINSIRNEKRPNNIFNTYTDSSNI